MNFNKREEQFMNIGTAANAVFHMRQVEEKELKRRKRHLTSNIFMMHL